MASAKRATTIAMMLLLSGCSSPKPVQQTKQLPDIVSPSKPMRTRPVKPLTAAQEAEFARALGGSGGMGAGGGGAEGGSGGGSGQGGTGGDSGGSPNLGSGAMAASSQVNFESAAPQSDRAKIDAAWGADGVESGKGIVYPVAPEVSGISTDMVSALKLADTDPRRRFVGIWDQVDGTGDADFAHGAYHQTVLVFRVDGLLDVIRLYGDKSETRIDSRLVYAVGADGALSLSQDPKLSGAARSNDLKLPGGRGKPSIVATAPRIKLPASLAPSINGDDMVLEGKRYRKRKPSEK